MATKPPFATTSVKQAVLGLVHRNKMRPSRPRMQQLAKPKPKSATLISQTEAKIRDYQTAKSAIETGASLASQNLAYSLTSPISLRVRKIRKPRLRQLRRWKRSFLS